jgi:hypothetical protein
MEQAGRKCFHVISLIAASSSSAAWPVASTPQRTKAPSPPSLPPSLFGERG